MQEQQPTRKPRVPLTKEELFYVVETKKLKQQEKIDAFKASKLYIIVNRINIVLAAFISYGILSVLFFSVWSSDVAVVVKSKHGEYNFETKKREITQLEIQSANNNIITVRTTQLKKEIPNNTPFFVGKDFIFQKIIKIKLLDNGLVFWCETAIATLTICCFALLMGFLIYLGNRHLTYNGLLTTLGLFLLASIYFIAV